MKGPAPKSSQELVGIVISGMQKPQEATVFAAYVWGPAPTVPEDVSPKAA
jgi:hypothetical protein